MTSTAAKGFAGLNSLITELDPNIFPVSQTENSPSVDTASSKIEEAPSRPRVYQSSSKPSSGSKNWFWWVAGILFLVWLVSKGDDQRSSSYQNSYSNSSTYNAYAEEKPAVGSNLVHSRAEIRYCLSEEIRLNAIESNINKHADAEISAYNAAISDYNSRCGAYRYRSGDLEAVRSQVEANRSTLMAQGLNKLRSWHPIVPSVDTSTTVPTSPSFNPPPTYQEPPIAPVPEPDIAPETKNTIEGAIEKFFEIFRSNGKAGIVIFLNGDCAAQTVMEEHQAIYCMAFDTMASGFLSAYEQKANYPLTPQFQDDAYNARMRLRLSKAGVDENEKQTKIIYGIQSEVNKALERMEAEGKTGLGQ